MVLYNFEYVFINYGDTGNIGEMMKTGTRRTISHPARVSRSSNLKRLKEEIKMIAGRDVSSF